MSNRDETEAEANGDVTLGFVSGLLLSIPLWVLIGIGLAVVFQPQISAESASLALMIAATIAAILARRSIRIFAGLGWPVRVPEAARFSFQAAASGERNRRALLRQSAALSALAIGYLHYYYWDVQLQIASLNSVTVFLPATSLS